MSAQDLGDLLRRAQEMQERLAALQRELARRTVQGSAGGGLVVVTATGELRILRIEIDPQLLAGNDRELLQDLVAAAVNAALSEAQRMMQEEMQRAAGGLPIPIGPTLPR
ncbi:MAG TPA: YbaB/EbfC family nucleoid-associated protein [Myxococcota bacterium]|nr:YbaB/EbfC family nucleoid-associated protein [Myxococcota bacterium]